MTSKISSMISAIGGVIIYSEKPGELAEWYRKHLGIEYEYTKEYDAYYTSFPYKEYDSGKKAYSAWSILRAIKRPVLEDRVFCVNYRVSDIEKVVEHLRSLNVSVKGPEEYPEGKFAWCVDPEGNYIELWEDTNIK
jgi:predicted enzyme related to lactoylglutathione lyase